MTARTARIPKTLGLLAATACCGPALGQQPGVTGAAQEAGEEPRRRYATEVIVFTYGDSVSSGTEIFVPEAPPEPPPNSLPGAFGEFADRPPGARPAAGSLSMPRDDRLTDGYADDAVPEFGDTLPLPADDDLPDEALQNEELDILVDATSVNLRVLLPDELTLVDEHEKLLRLDAYQPVLWAGWEQDVRDVDLSPPVKLRRLGNVPLTMSGEFKLYLGRFLHLVANISMQAPSSVTGYRSYRAQPPTRFGQDYGYTPDGYPKETPVFYEINDNRIMKSGDLRYFDHPRFGVLARVTRIEEALPEEQEDGKLLSPNTDDLAPASSPGGDSPPR